MPIRQRLTALCEPLATAAGAVLLSSGWQVTEHGEFLTRPLGIGILWPWPPVGGHYQHPAIGIHLAQIVRQRQIEPVHCALASSRHMACLRHVSHALPRSPGRLGLGTPASSWA